MPMRLLKGIRHFKNNQFKDKKDKFTALVKGQSPDVLFFGCIDSRVDLRMITNANPGEMLIDRNPGNIVTPYSPTPSGEAASIEFALNHLHVEEIIVCGHSHCGAIKGLMTPGLADELPSTASWLSHAKPALENLQRVHPELDEHPALKLVQLTQDNILLQIEHLKTHPAVAKRLAQGNLKIHGWYYEFETGEVYIYNATKKAFISFEETVEEVALAKLTQIIERETLTYLNTAPPPNNSPAKLFSSAVVQISIWEKIRENVLDKAKKEFGELYLKSNGKLSSKFDTLLDREPLELVRVTQDKYQQISDLFIQALSHQANPLLDSEQKNLLALVAPLKEQTLTQFTQSCEFSHCMLLAIIAVALVDKLVKKTAQTADIDSFSSACTKFDNCDISLKYCLASLVTIATELVYHSQPSVRDCAKI